MKFPIVSFFLLAIQVNSTSHALSAADIPANRNLSSYLDRQGFPTERLDASAAISLGLQRVGEYFFIDPPTRNRDDPEDSDIYCDKEEFKGRFLEASAGYYTKTTKLLVPRIHFGSTYVNQSDGISKITEQFGKMGKSYKIPSRRSLTSHMDPPPPQGVHYTINHHGIATHVRFSLQSSGCLKLTMQFADSLEDISIGETTKKAADRAVSDKLRDALK